MLVENAKVHAESDSENIKLIVQDWLYESGFGKCLLRNNDIVNIGWHIYLKDITAYAAIPRDS